MAYCKKCGAYIPDGQIACLACGYDEAAEKAKEQAQQSGAASAYAFEQKSEEQIREEEMLRARAEARRRQQQEMNRKWAESEARRRQQQEDFRRAQEEAAARARAQEAQYRPLNEDGYSRLHRVNATPNTTGAGSSRTLAVLSYISFLCFLPSLLGAEDAYTRFHAKQGRKLFWASLILSWIPGVNSIAWLFQIALAVIGIRNAANGQMEKLPVVGNLFEH